MLGIIIDEFFGYRKDHLTKEQVYIEIEKLHQLANSQEDLSISNVNIGSMHYVLLKWVSKRTVQSVRFIWWYSKFAGWYEFKFDNNWYAARKIEEAS